MKSFFLTEKLKLLNFLIELGLCLIIGYCREIYEEKFKEVLRRRRRKKKKKEMLTSMLTLLSFRIELVLFPKVLVNRVPYCFILFSFYYLFKREEIEINN